MSDSKENLRTQLKEILDDELFQILLFNVAKKCSFKKKVTSINNLTEDDFNKINLEIIVYKAIEPRPSSYFKLVALHFCKDEIDKSLEYLEKFLELYQIQPDVDLLDELTHYAFKASKYIDRYEEKGDVIINVGMFYLASGKYTEAINVFEQLLIDTPDDWVYFYYLGFCYFELNQLEKVMECINKILSFDHDNKDIYNLLGYYYYKLKDYDKAIEFFNKLKEAFYEKIEISKENNVQINTNNQETTFNYDRLMGCYSKSGKLEELIGELENILLSNPDNEVLLTDLGVCYIDLKDYNKAFDVLNKALSIDPYYSMALRAIGTYYFHQENYNQAVYYYKESIRIECLNLYTYDCLGQSYVKLKDYDKAIRWYKGSLSYHMSYGKAYYALAEIYKFIGKNDLATKYFDKLALIEPDYQSLYEEIMF